MNALITGTWGFEFFIEDKMLKYCLNAEKQNGEVILFLYSWLVFHIPLAVYTWS